ncbi:MAG: hypothetical protein ACRD0P_15145 [Stackebrandtia sp.]
MYGWLWRKLPFGLPGKIAGSVILCLGAAALLWFVAFPQLSSVLTPTQSTVDNDGGGESEPGQEQDESGSDRVTDNPSDYKTEESPPAGEGSGSGD